MTACYALRPCRSPFDRVGVPARIASAGLVAATVILASCSGSAEKGRPVGPPPPGAPVVEVKMLDYRFEHDTVIPSGRVVFRARNEGKAAHHLTLIPVPHDVGSIDAQLRGGERRFVRPFAGFFDRAPRDTGTFAVDLQPGRRYAMICAVLDESGEPHWRRGMTSEFETPSKEPG